MSTINTGKFLSFIESREAFVNGIFVEFQHNCQNPAFSLDDLENQNLSRKIIENLYLCVQILKVKSHCLFYFSGHSSQICLCLNSILRLIYQCKMKNSTICCHGVESPAKSCYFCECFLARETYCVLWFIINSLHLLLRETFWVVEIS